MIGEMKAVERAEPVVCPRCRNPFLAVKLIRPNSRVEELVFECPECRTVYRMKIYSEKFRD